MPSSWMKASITYATLVAAIVSQSCAAHSARRAEAAVPPIDMALAWFERDMPSRLTVIAGPKLPAKVREALGKARVVVQIDPRREDVPDGHVLLTAVDVNGAVARVRGVVGPVPPRIPNFWGGCGTHFDIPLRFVSGEWQVADGIRLLGC